MRVVAHDASMDDVNRFVVEYTNHELQQINFDPFDRAVLSQPIDNAADILLNLELIFRRYGEQLNPESRE